MPVRNTVKSLVLPHGAAFRRLPLGVAAGVTMKIDFAHQTTLYLGLYEVELSPHVRRLVRPGSRCFDVGADVGYYTLLLARRSGRPVVAFESAASVARCLRDNIARNACEVEVYTVCVGDRDGDGRMTLDRAAAETFVPDLIKMDIEGGEVAALEGAGGILGRRRPHLIIEVHGRRTEDRCIEILGRHGYAPVVVERRRWLAETRPAGHNRWLVCEGRAR